MRFEMLPNIDDGLLWVNNTKVTQEEGNLDHVDMGDGI